MSTFRNVSFVRSDNDKNDMWAIRAHRGDFNPDKHADLLPLSECACTMGFRKGKNRIIKVIDLRNGNVYYGESD